MSTLDAGLLDLIVDLWRCDPLEDASVERRSRQLLLDTMGCAIAGQAVASTRAFAQALAETEPGPLRLPGADAGLSASGFVAAFSAGACAFEAPEGLASAQGRPGLHAVPAVLAHSLGRDTPLRAVLDALVIGYEVGGRIGQIYRILPGMHVDGTWGTFGATAAVARLLGLPSELAHSATNIAACHLPLSLYFPITEGSLARNLYVGHGAAIAGVAVAAANSGIDGPRGALAEHMRLLLGSAPELPQRGSSEPWLITHGYLKKYPVTKHVHYGVEAALRWLKSGGRIDKADWIVLRIYRNAITYCGQRAPTTPIQAQFSLSWGLAWALVHEDLTVEAVSERGLRDERVRALEARIEIEEDADLTREDRRGAKLVVEGPAGPNAVSVDGVPGDPDQPLSELEIVDKFVAGAEPVIGEARARAITVAILEGDPRKALTLD